MISTKLKAIDSLSNMFFDTQYQNLVQFKHACLNDYRHRDEHTTLQSCNCAYHTKFHLPCWHMQQLALKSGIYDSLFKDAEFLYPSIQSLSDGAFIRLGHLLYYGYYDRAINIKDLGRYKNPLIRSGLIVNYNNKLMYSSDVQKHIYYILFIFMSDARSSKFFS